MKKIFIRILSIVLCLTLVTGGAAFSSAANLPATNTDAVATPDAPATPDIPSTPDIPEAVVTENTPFRISVAVNGDTTSSKGITWYTKANTASVVNIYDESGAKVNVPVAYAEVFEFEGNYVHKALVSGLEAGKTYYYDVGNETVRSAAGKFVTDNADNKLNFIAVADIQASSIENFQAGAKVVDAAFRTMPEAEFMINLGDFTNDSTNEE